MKVGCHGLPSSRAKGGHVPGISPGPVGNRLLLGPAIYATTKPTDLVRGPHQSRAAKGGAGANPAGKRLASDIRHRVDTGQEAKGLPLIIGGKERVREVCLNERQARQ